MPLGLFYMYVRTGGLYAPIYVSLAGRLVRGKVCRRSGSRHPYATSGGNRRPSGDVLQISPHLCRGSLRAMTFEVNKNRLYVKAVHHFGAENLQLIQTVLDFRIAEVIEVGQQDFLNIVVAAGSSTLIISTRSSSNGTSLCHGLLVRLLTSHLFTAVLLALHCVVLFEAVDLKIASSSNSLNLAVCFAEIFGFNPQAVFAH